jgi:methyl-accepting chemotaxis protein
MAELTSFVDLVSKLLSFGPGGIATLVAIALAYVLYKREDKGLTQVVETLKDLNSKLEVSNVLTKERDALLKDELVQIGDLMHQRLSKVEQQCDSIKEDVVIVKTTLTNSVRSH